MKITLKFVLDFLKKNILLLILGGFLFVLFFIFDPSTLFPISVDFRGNLWEPAYLLVHRMNPYYIEGIFDNLNPLWFPMIIGLFFPLGYLPLQWASNIWFAFSCIVLFLIVAIMARQSHKPVGYVMLTIIALALFPSSVGHFKYGQVSFFISLLFLILSLYRKQLSPFFTGLLLSLCFTKPQIAVLFLPAFLVVYFTEQGKERFLRMFLSTILWGVIFFIPLFIAYPNWIPTFISNLQTNPLWAYPSLYYLLVLTLGFDTPVFVLAGLYLLIGIGVAVFLTYKLEKFEALLWSMALTPLFSPVIWSNDFVLMYPLLLLVVFDERSKRGSWVAIVGYIACAILIISMKNSGYIDDHYVVWVPVFLNAILALSYQIRRRKINQDLKSAADSSIA